MCLQRSSKRVERKSRPSKPGWKVVAHCDLCGCPICSSLVGNAFTIVFIGYHQNDVLWKKLAYVECWTKQVALCSNFDSLYWTISISHCRWLTWTTTYCCISNIFVEYLTLASVLSEFFSANFQFVHGQSDYVNPFNAGCSKLLLFEGFNDILV